MSRAGSYRWGLSPNTYMLPQPFGHVLSWRVFKRNQKVTTSMHDTAMFIKENLTQVANENYKIEFKEIKAAAPENLKITKTNIDGTTHINTLILEIKDKNIVLEKDSWILILKNEYTKNEKDYYPTLTQITSIQPVGVDNIKKYSLKVFPDDNLNYSFTNTETSEEVTVKLVTSMKITSDGGWNGDPRNIRELSNNSHEDSWHIEIVTQHTNESNIRNADNWQAHTFPATRWTAINAVQKVCDQAASTMIEYLVKNYNKDLETKFHQIKQKETQDMEEIWSQAFQPLQVTEGHSGKFTYIGGYLLLKDEKNKRKSVNPIVKEDDEKRFKLIEVNEEGNPTTVDNTTSNTNTRVSNCVIGKHVYVQENDTVVNFLNDISEHKRDTDEDMFRRSYEYTEAVPDQEVRMRLHLTSGGVSMSQARDTDAILQPGMSQFDTVALPFEHDLHSTNSEQFNRELETALRLVGQCLLATIEMPTPTDLAAPLEATPPKTFPFNVNAISNEIWGESVRSHTIRTQSTPTISASASVTEHADIYTGKILFVKNMPDDTLLPIEHAEFKFKEIYSEIYRLYKASLSEWYTYTKLRSYWIPPVFNTSIPIGDDLTPLVLGDLTDVDYTLGVYGAKVKNDNVLSFNIIVTNIKKMETGDEGDERLYQKRTYEFHFNELCDKLVYVKTPETPDELDDDYFIGVVWVAEKNTNAVADSNDAKYSIQKTLTSMNPEVLSVLSVETPLNDPIRTEDALKNYINKTDPWRQHDDSEYGACSELLWKPCLEYAGNYKNKLPDVDDIGKLLMNIMPFGMLTDEKSALIDLLVKNVHKNTKLYDEDGNMRYILLEEAPENTNPMPWEPLILQYGITMNGSDFNSCQWALGCEPTLLLESIQILLIYLQKIIVLSTSGDENPNNNNNIKRRENITGWDTYPNGMMSVVHTSAEKEYFTDLGLYHDHTNSEIRPIESINGTIDPCKCIKNVGKNRTLRDELYLTKEDRITDTEYLKHYYGNFIPGNPNFYSARSFVRKEIEFRDTLFSVANIDTCDSRDPVQMKTATQTTEKPDKSIKSKNKWTGMFLFDTFTSQDYKKNTLYLIKSSVSKNLKPPENPDTEKRKLIFDINWGGIPIFRNSAKLHQYVPYTGRGTWKTNSPAISAHRYTSQRFRKYTGKIPNTSSNQMYTPENTWQAKLISKTFDSRINNTKWIFPDIPIDSKNASENFPPNINVFGTDKDSISTFLGKSFVGWHYSNNKALGRTVFALACNKFHMKIEEYFLKKDREYNEERGIRIMSAPSNLKDEAKLLHLIFKGSPQNPLGYTKTNPMVVKGIVMVKGNSVDALTTACIAGDYLCKTESYRIIESEVWSVLLKRLRQIRGIPVGSVKGCLGYIINKCCLNEKRALRIKELIRLRSSIVPALSRIMVALHIHNATWIDTQKFRDRDSVEIGTVHTILIYIYKCCTYIEYMCLNRNGLHSRYRLRSVVPVLNYTVI